MTATSRSSAGERAAREAMLALLRETPLPDEELCDNIPLFLRRQNLMELLALAELYHRILEIPGTIFDFGTRWGRKLVTFVSLRGALEPYNVHRWIVGFDTFTGFPDVESVDGTSERLRVGAFATTEGYPGYLRRLIEVHASESPLAHVNRCEIREGDVKEGLAAYLQEHRETVVALAYFDMDLYAPTRAALELIAPRLTRGSILAFDELCHPDFPGETIALLESFTLSAVKLRKIAGHPFPSYITCG